MTTIGGICLHQNVTPQSGWARSELAVDQTFFRTVQCDDCEAVFSEASDSPDDAE